MNVWVEAARPRTLSAAVVPVFVGTAAAGRVIGWRFACALIVALSIQVAVNYANDLFDAQRGVDTEERLGPRRATAAGLVSPRAMKTAMVAALSVTAAAGLALTIAVGWELLIVGLLSFVALLGYSGGPRPYASLGLGEVFVFVFFGVVATVGSAYVQIERVTDVAVAASIPVGALAVALLVVNNLRDIPTDTKVGKRTLAVRLGVARTRNLYEILIGVAFLTLFKPVADAAGGPWPLLALVAFPLAAPALLVTERAEGRALIPALVWTARLQLAFGGLLAVGLWLER